MIPLFSIPEIQLRLAQKELEVKASIVRALHRRRVRAVKEIEKEYVLEVMLKFGEEVNHTFEDYRLEILRRIKEKMASEYRLYFIGVNDVYFLGNPGEKPEAETEHSFSIHLVPRYNLKEVLTEVRDNSRSDNTQRYRVLYLDFLYDILGSPTMNPPPTWLFDTGEISILTDTEWMDKEQIQELEAYYEAHIMAPARLIGLV